MDIFSTFKKNSEYFIVNRSHPLAAGLSASPQNDFSLEPGQHAGYEAGDFSQKGLQINFSINQVPFVLHAIGKHNMENAVAAATVAALAGVPLATSAKALANK